ncbi:natural killer cell receptor 2B4-like [Sparus aurata]|uniref:natural killer cell receptor 2B4-like n=1 Tax=Sparus aurata TaxID=8175 RepID=UPI0011C155A0|nr:natural killer cell receptor 2B4-like [Sparus aurata]
MGDIPLVFTVILVYLSQMQGSSAVTPVFVQKGDDVMLNLTEADVPENRAVYWNFNNSDKEFLVRWLPPKEPEVSPGYTGRIEFTVKKYCVKLKNLQETDSKVYTARVIGAVGVETKAEYYLTVQDPVSPVKLTVDSVSSSSDSCNLTVTCSTQDSHISSTFTCDNKTCSQEGGERSEVTTSAASLRVYLVNDSITCNHSNQVSWTNNVTKIWDLCPRRDDPNAHSVNVAVSVSITFLFLIIIAAASFCYLLWRRKQQAESTLDAVYAVPEMEAVAQPLDPTSDSSSPPSIYSLLEPHTGPTTSTDATDIVYSTI